MTNDNSDQIEFWNSDHGLAWARYADTVDVMFSAITDAVPSGRSITSANCLRSLSSDATIIAIMDEKKNGRQVAP